MLKKIFIALSLASVALIVFSSVSAYSFPEGAPVGVTGSPADGKSCTKCHEGMSAFKDGWIKSDMDTSGYVGGKTYKFTATATGLASTKKFGFEVSPQDLTGKLMGTLITTNTEETQIIGKGKYITHTEGGTNGSTSKSWKFSWTAPPKGSGAVTFYGAFVLGPKPYGVITTSLKISEAK